MYIKPTSLAKQTEVHIEKDGYATMPTMVILK